MAEVAVLAAGAGGAYLGSIVGGPLGASIGWGIGTAIGSELFGPDAPEVEGPRLGDLSVQSSAYGQPLPHIDGVARVAGNVIWSSGIAETRHTEEVGGKGGGGEVTQVSYTYSASFAVSINDDEISFVPRVWADGKLIYDMSPGATPESILASLSNIPVFTVHKGDENQLPDPLMQAELGVDNVPAYRGTAYLVFENMALADYGNRLPNITAEVVTTVQAKTHTAAGTPYRPDTNNLIRLSSYSDGIISWWRSVDSFVNQNSNQAWTWKTDINGGIVESRKTITYSAGGAAGFLINTQVVNSGLGHQRADAGIVVDGSGTHVGFFVGQSPKSYPLLNTQGVGIYGLNNFGIWHALFALNNIYVVPGGTPTHQRQYTLYRFVWNSAYPNAKAAAEKTFVGIVMGTYENNGLLYVHTQTNTTEMEIHRLDPESLAIEMSWTINHLDLNSSMALSVTDDFFLFAGDSQNKYNAFQFFDDGSTLVSENGAITTGIGNGPIIILPSVGLVMFHLTWLTTRPLVTGAGDALGNVVSDICTSAGLNLADIDVSQLTQTLTGYVRSRPMSARAAIAPLQRAYYFDAVESDGVLRFVRRGGAAVATINEDELGAHQNGQTPPSALLSIRTQEIDLPREVAVHYINPAFNYQPGIQRSQRQVTLSQQKISVQLPIAMSDDQGAQIAEVLLFNTWAERQKLPLQLGIKYAWLDAADVINVVGNNASYGLRINKINTQNPGLLQLETVVEQADIYTSEAVGEASPVIISSLGLAGPTQLYLLDVPLLQDVDDNAGFYLSAHGLLSGWSGAVLYQSADDGASWYSLTSLLSAATGGLCTTILASGLTTVWDNQSLTIHLNQGSLAAATELAVLNGANAAAVGVDGRWEIIQFQDVVLNGDGTYTISRLLRGRKGTEWAVGTHLADDRFILLTADTLGRYVPNTDKIGVAALYKAPALGTTLAAAEKTSFTHSAVGLKPYAPVHISAQRDGSANLSIDWIRRSRIGGDWRDNVDVELGEDSESYEVDIMNGAAVVRTLTSATQTVTYTAADQVTDFGSAQASIDVNIYQLSATVGRGYPGAATL